MKLKGTKREVLDRLLCFLGKQRGKPDSTLCSFSFLSRVKLSFSFNRYSDLVVSVLANHFVISLNSEDSKTWGQKESGREGEKTFQPFVYCSVFTRQPNVFFMLSGWFWSRVTAQIKPDRFVKKPFLSHIHFYQWRLKETNWVGLLEAVARHMKWPLFMLLMDVPDSFHFTRPRCLFLWFPFSVRIPLHFTHFLSLTFKDSLCPFRVPLFLAVSE